MSEPAEQNVAQTPPPQYSADDPRTTLITLATLGVAGALGILLILARAEQLQPLLPEPIVRIFNPTPRPLAFLPSPSPRATAVPRPSVDPGQVIDAATLPSISINQMFSQQAWLLSGNTLVAVDTANQATKVTTDYLVSNFAFHPESGTLAYLQGEPTPGNAKQVRNFAAYLRTADGTTQKIHAFPYIGATTDSPEIQLTDVAFSANGKFLALTVTDGLFVYDLENQKLVEVFRQTGTAYSRPYFSPNASKILLQAAAQYPQPLNVELVVVDLTNKSLTPIPQAVEYALQTPLGWQDDSHIYVAQAMQMTDQLRTELVSIDTISGEVSTLPQQELVQTHDLVIKNQKAYISGYVEEKTPGNVSPPIALYEFTSNFQTATQLLPDSMKQAGFLYLSADITGNTVMVTRLDEKLTTNITTLHELSPGLPLIMTIKNAQLPI